MATFTVSCRFRSKRCRKCNQVGHKTRLLSFQKPGIGNPNLTRPKPQARTNRYIKTKPTNNAIAFRKRHNDRQTRSGRPYRSTPAVPVSRSTKRNTGTKDNLARHPEVFSADLGRYETAKPPRQSTRITQPASRLKHPRPKAVLPTVKNELLKPSNEAFRPFNSSRKEKRGGDLSKKFCPCVSR